MGNMERPSETAAAESSHHSSENEVEIKEEPPDVVEISSEDEKPDLKQLNNSANNLTEKPITSVNNEPQKNLENTTQQQTVTKRINDLIITVPQVTATRKIKLNRNKVNVSTNNSSTSHIGTHSATTVTQTATSNVDTSKKISQESTENKPKKKKKIKKKKNVEKDNSDHDEITLQLSDSEKMDLLEDLDESRKNYDKVSSSSEDSESSSSDSDDDDISSKSTPAESNSLINENKQNEIEDTLKEISSHQTNLNSLKNNTVEISSSGCEVAENNIDHPNTNISESLNSNVQQPQNENSENKNNAVIDTDNTEKNSSQKNCDNLSEILEQKTNSGDTTNADSTMPSPEEQINENLEKICPTVDSISNDGSETHNTDSKNSKTHSLEDTDNILINKTIEVSEETALSCKALLITTSSNDNRTVTLINKPLDSEINTFNEALPSETQEKDNISMEIVSIDNRNILSNSSTNINYNSTHVNKKCDATKESELNLSEGELSDRQSSEVEAIDIQPVVVCISDEESPKMDKKKKKKEKKSKKKKKSKKSKSDFREGSDQNFYKDPVLDSNNRNIKSLQDNINLKSDKGTIELDSDDVCEYFELSDDSSCYEVEGTVLSKEPTAEEIEALSAKIDEIEREDVVTDAQIRDHEEMETDRALNEKDEVNLESISWKERYLGSKKVKKVLTISNILNALRKKNKQLKKKIQESKEIEETIVENDVPIENFQLEEGSIEQYNTLQRSTKYVNPVKEPVDVVKDSDENKKAAEKLVTDADDKTITKEMKKDARQLLKMYRRLLKHNDMNKKKDPSKKKKNKQKKKEKQNLDKTIATTTLTDGTTN